MKGFILVCLLLLLSACQSTPPSLVSRYASDVQVQARLREMNIGGGIALLDFSTDVAKFGQDTCRSRPIRLPRGETLAEYVRSAFETEFFRAQVYDPDSFVVLTGTVTRIQLRRDGQITSGAIGGTWLIDLELFSSNGRKLQVRAGHAYRTDFQTINCPEAAKALMPAVQKLVRAAVTHPRFPRLLENGN